MRSFVLALVAVASLSGCFGEGCWDSDRADQWLQPEYWEWQPDPSLGLDVRDSNATGTPWPMPPSTWRGRNEVLVVSHVVRGDYNVRVTDRLGIIDVSAFLPQKMAAADRAEEIRTAVAGATDASDAEVDAVVQQLMDADDGGDSSGRFTVARETGLHLDLAGLAAQGDWEAKPVEPGQWQLSNDEWLVDVRVDSRSIWDPARGFDVAFRVDAGGFVQGPMLDAEFDEAERRANTTAMLAGWRAPAPTYAQASTNAQLVCT